MTITTETAQMAILATPMAVIALAALAWLLLLLNKWRPAVIVALLALSLNAWTEQIPFHAKRNVPAVKPAGTLRIFEYNVCGKKDYAPLHEDSTFVNYIVSVDADFLFLPENTAGTCPMLDEELREVYPYSVHDFEEFNHPYRGDDYTLYSRYPLSDFRRFRVDRGLLRSEHPWIDSLQLARQSDDILAALVTADIDGTPVDLMHVHLRTNGYDYAREEAEGVKRERVRHTYSALLFGYAFRAVEVDTLAQYIANSPNPVIVAGDFNDLSGSYCVSRLQECRNENTHPEHRDRLRDAWWSGGQGFGFTYADQHLRFRIDHILYSREFELQAVSVPRVSYSDHRPLVADFRFIGCQ